MCPKSFSPFSDIDRINLIRLLIVSTTIILFIPLLAHSILGSYTRYIADDWCTATTVRSQGLIGAQYTWYMNWSGRYAFTFTVSLMELIGVKVVPYLPTIALGLWLTASTWSLYQFRAWGYGSIGLSISILTSSLLIFTVLEIIPNVHQSLYWQTGMLTYIAPLILATIIIGLFVRKFRRSTVHHLPGSALFLAILATITGGFSEMYVAMQTTAFLIAIVIFLIISSDDRKRPTITLLVASLIGSLVSMAIIFFAPGNEIRQALTPESPGLFTVIRLSLVFAFKFVGKSILLSPLPTLLALFVPALITFSLPLSEQGTREIQSHLDKTNLSFYLFLSPFVGYLIIASSMAPSVYGVSAFPEDRTLTIPQFVLTSMIIFWGTIGGLAFKKRTGLIAKHKSRITILGCFLVAALLILSPLLPTIENLSRVPTLRAYADRWDLRDHEIRVAQEGGANHLTVTALGFTGGLADISDKPEDWVNRCFAEYYGLDSVISE